MQTITRSTLTSSSLPLFQDSTDEGGERHQSLEAKSSLLNQLLSATSQDTETQTDPDYDESLSSFTFFRELQEHLDSNSSAGQPRALSESSAGIHDFPKTQKTPEAVLAFDLPEVEHVRDEDRYIHRTCDKLSGLVKDPDTRAQIEQVRNLKLARAELKRQIRSCHFGQCGEADLAHLNSQAEALKQKLDDCVPQVQQKLKRPEIQPKLINQLEHEFTPFKTKIEQLESLVSRLKAAYPEMDQGELLSQMRRSIPDYNKGLWSWAMPGNQGPSILEHHFQAEICHLRDTMCYQNGLDFGHVLTSMDVAQSRDLLPDDAYASWAGDLGSAALNCFKHDKPLRIGDEEQKASLSDLLADIDGDNLAAHAQMVHELAAIPAYYQNDGRYSGGMTAKNRFHCFAGDLKLLDEHNNLKGDAREYFHEPTLEFMWGYHFYKNVTETIPHFGKLFKGAADPNGERRSTDLEQNTNPKQKSVDGPVRTDPKEVSPFTDKARFEALAQQASVQFAAILSKAINSERLQVINP